MTPYEDVYAAFMSKTLDDEWFDWTEEQILTDMRTLLESAIPNFKFPRVSLERNDEGFLETLGSEEIQILATYMKCEWLNRTILRWENVKPLYVERDFSQANLLDKFTKLLASEKNEGRKLESFYYRSVKGIPFDYRKLAGGSQ